MKSVVLNQRSFISWVTFGNAGTISGCPNWGLLLESSDQKPGLLPNIWPCSSQRKNGLAPSVNCTEVEEPTLGYAFVWSVFSTGPAYPLGYTCIWSLCHVIFTQTVHQMECRLPESSIVTAGTVWVAAEQGPQLESADVRMASLLIDTLWCGCGHFVWWTRVSASSTFKLSHTYIVNTVKFSETGTIL